MSRYLLIFFLPFISFFFFPFFLPFGPCFLPFLYFFPFFFLFFLFLCLLLFFPSLLSSFPTPLPSLPSLMCLCPHRDGAMPSPGQILEVSSRFVDNVAVACAVVTGGEVRLYTFTPMNLPSPQPYTSWGRTNLMIVLGRCSVSICFKETKKVDGTVLHFYKPPTAIQQLREDQVILVLGKV